MENDQFDALIRTLSGADSSRRETLRVLRGMLLGGALSGVVARLGLGEGAAAKGKKHQKAKSKRQRKARTEHRQHGQFQAEGQHKGKGKGKHHKHKPRDPTPPPPLPPGCENCNECQMCQDGACARPGPRRRSLPGQRGHLWQLAGRAVHRLGPAAVPGRDLSSTRPVLSRREEVRRPREPDGIRVPRCERLLP